MAHACPYNRQSSHAIPTATVTSYIWVIKNSDLHMETTSPYEGHTRHPSFFVTPSSYFRVTPLYIQVTQNTTLAMSNPSNDIGLMGSTI